MRITFVLHPHQGRALAAGLRAPAAGADIRCGTRRAAGRLRRGLGAAPAVHDEQPGLKASSTSAPAWMRCCSCACRPRRKVVRLDDAGMSVQMAEYVCHAVIRHFREFDGYEADMAQGRGRTASRGCAADFPVGVMGLGVLGERVAQALAQFEFPVNGWSRTPRPSTACVLFGRAVERLSGGQPRAGVPAAADARHAPNILNRDTLGATATGRLCHQRGARRAPGGRRPAGAAGQRPPGRRHAGRVPHRAAAAGHPFWNHPKSPSRRTPRRARCATKALPRSPARSWRWSAGEARRRCGRPPRGY
jgi:glyoxylate/hydroxypyruvate reductase A